MGRPDSVKALLETRRLTWEKWKVLAETYRGKGEEEFLAELVKPSLLPAIGVLQRLYSAEGKDAKSVATIVADMLRQADLHSARLLEIKTQEVGSFPGSKDQ
jgi:hypothetical protein